MGEGVQVSLCLCYLCDDVDGDVVVWLDCAVAFVSLRGVGSHQWRLPSSHVFSSSPLYGCVYICLSVCVMVMVGGVGGCHFQCSQIVC